MSGVYIRGRVAPGWPYLVPDCVFAVRLSIVYRIVAYLAGSGFSTGVVGFVAIRDPDRPESSIRFLKDLRSARYDGELRGNLIRYLTALSSGPACPPVVGQTVGQAVRVGLPVLPGLLGWLGCRFGLPGRPVVGQTVGQVVRVGLPVIPGLPRAGLGDRLGPPGWPGPAD